ncbi:MAG: glycosyltransferase [Desulfoprunum sp.]
MIFTSLSCNEDILQVAYVGPFLFPWGHPGSRRVCGMARSLAEVGYDVVVGSGSATPIAPINLDEGEIPGSITYVGLGELPPPGSSILAKSMQIFIHWGKKTVAWLDAQPVKPSYVIVYGGSAQYMFRLLPWCRQNNIPLIADIVEWYAPHQLTGGYFGPFHISAKIALKYQYSKCDGIIAISSFLKEYYIKLGCKVILVPPTIDASRVGLTPHNTRDKEHHLSLIYSGTPARKDLLGNIIQGISKIDPNGQYIRLLVIGPSLEQVKFLLNDSNPPPFVKILGRIPQNDVAEVLKEADFSVLLREPQRYAQAGFPTKFVESMASGVPVIANLTSDLGAYLHDGINGLICSDHSVNAFAETLQRAMHLPYIERKEMRNAARKEAERSFDFRIYSMNLKSFLSKLML